MISNGSKHILGMASFHSSIKNSKWVCFKLTLRLSELSYCSSFESAFRFCKVVFEYLDPEVEDSPIKISLELTFRLRNILSASLLTSTDEMIEKKDSCRFEGKEEVKKGSRLMKPEDSIKMMVFLLKKDDSWEQIVEIF